MFDHVGEDLGAADEDILDKMALDNAHGDAYDDGWVIEDEDELGNAAPYRVGANQVMDGDETGLKEMGEQAVFQKSLTLIVPS